MKPRKPISDRTFCTTLAIKIKQKGLVNERPKSVLFNISMITLVNISQYGTSSKTTTTSLKKIRLLWQQQYTTWYCKIVCCCCFFFCFCFFFLFFFFFFVVVVVVVFVGVFLIQFHSFNLGKMQLKAFPFVSFIFVKYCSTTL